jgi:uncharacterized repeat protein (TIGR03803 family)
MIGQRKCQMTNMWTGRIALSSAIMLFLAVVSTGEAHAQSYHVIYNFTGCVDGSLPSNTLLLDKAGSLYGTTIGGGSSCGEGGMGVAFQLRRNGNEWAYSTMHRFTGNSRDGASPYSYGGLAVGPDGGYYGTASLGGAANAGVVFRIRVRPQIACKTLLCPPWTEDIVHQFTGSPDGEEPLGSVAFDAAGNMYGTTVHGGPMSGAAYMISPFSGGWTESVLAGVEGNPLGTLVLDQAGNLYGITFSGGSIGRGTVFQLMPTQAGWMVNVLHTFTGDADGANPFGGLVLDAAGNIFGSTTKGGRGGGGTIFELTPSDNGWTFNTIYSLSGVDGPASALTMDAASNFYGTTTGDGVFELGSIFKLSHSKNGWGLTDLYDFRGGSDGYGPLGGVTMDVSGNLYGTTAFGGASDAGVAWEITPN